jgi:hypothetical protein
MLLTNRRAIAFSLLLALPTLFLAAVLLPWRGNPSVASPIATQAATPATTLGTAVPSSACPSCVEVPTAAPAVSNAVALGAYVPGAPSDPSKLDEFATLTGTMPRIVMWFQTWAPPWNAFDVAGADEIRARGATPMISWEPRASHSNFDRNWSLDSINNGSHDAYIHQWTHDVAAWGHPLYVRLMHEMNGPWTSWSPGLNGNSSNDFVAAWRHIVDIAREEGAVNIRWIWAPNIDDGDSRYTPYSKIFPGDDYVDWVGLTGYNWGTSQSWSKWESLPNVFKGSIDELRSLSSKPVMLAEMGSAEDGGNKGSWITDGFSHLLTDLPEVRAVVWFDAFDPRLGTHWEVNSSPGALSAFRAVAASRDFAGVLP